MRLSNEETQEMNLQGLIHGYRDQGRAKRGFDRLSKAVSANNVKFLKRFLRDHRYDSIIDAAEIKFRDQVDFLIGFYGLLELGILTGYVSLTLNSRMQEEIELILENDFVRRYYVEYYPLLLPQVLLKATKLNKNQPNSQAPEVIDSLLFLGGMLDDDVEDFLWLLDDGYFKGGNIVTLLSILKDRERMRKLLSKSKKEENRIDRAFWGFQKFTNYMVGYHSLLLKCANDRLLHSAVWHYQSYWFDGIRDKLQRAYLVGIKNLEALSSSFTDGDFAHDASPDRSKTRPSLARQLWESQSKGEIERIARSLEYNLETSHKIELWDFYHEF